MRRVERDTALVFAMSGAVQASWLSRLPALAGSLRLDLRQLGFALFALGIGSLVSMPMTGRLCRRFGTRRVVEAATLLACLSLVGLGGVSSMVGLWLVLLGLGLGSGAWDAAMNLHGVAVDDVDDVSRMPMFHGFWSAGSVVGAGLGASAAWLHVPISTHFTLVAIGGAALCLLAVRGFADVRSLPGVRPPSPRLPALRRLLLLGLLTVCGLTIEGAAGDWLALYLTDDRGASHARAAIGYTLFLLASATGRFLAGTVERRIGRVRTIQVGAALAAAGVAISVVAPVAVVAYAGALCWGLGICVVFPTVLSAGGHSGSGDEVAILTTVGYVAAFAAPPLIGTGGQRIGLGYALLLLPILAIAVIVVAPVVGPGNRSWTPPLELAD